MSIPFLFLSACIDEVDVKIQDPAEFPLVVDCLAIVDDTSGVSYVRLSKAFSLNSTVDDSNPDLFGLIPFALSNPVKGAIVEIIDQNGQLFTVTEIINFPGWYSIRNNSFKTGNSYSLNVVAEGKEYSSAFQTLYPKPVIDSVAVLSNEYLSNNGLGFNSFIEVKPFYLSSSFKTSNDGNAFYTWSYTGINLSSFQTFSEEGLSENIIIPLETNWFDYTPRNDGFLSQYRLNENFYQYINDAQNLLEDSSPFSTPPVNPSNNLRCVSDPEKEILGFFEVASVSRIEYKSAF